MDNDLRSQFGKEDGRCGRIRRRFRLLGREERRRRRVAQIRRLPDEAAVSGQGNARRRRRRRRRFQLRRRRRSGCVAVQLIHPDAASGVVPGRREAAQRLLDGQAHLIYIPKYRTNYQSIRNIWHFIILILFIIVITN